MNQPARITIMSMLLGALFIPFAHAQVAPNGMEIVCNPVTTTQLTTTCELQVPADTIGTQFDLIVPGDQLSTLTDLERGGNLSPAGAFFKLSLEEQNGDYFMEIDYVDLNAQQFSQDPFALVTFSLTYNNLQASDFPLSTVAQLQTGSALITPTSLQQNQAEFTSQPETPLPFDFTLGNTSGGAGGNTGNNSTVSIGFNTSASSNFPAGTDIPFSIGTSPAITATNTYNDSSFPVGTFTITATLPNGTQFNAGSNYNVTGANTLTFTTTAGATVTLDINVTNTASTGGGATGGGGSTGGGGTGGGSTGGGSTGGGGSSGGSSGGGGSGGGGGGGGGGFVSTGGSSTSPYCFDDAQDSMTLEEWAVICEAKRRGIVSGNPRGNRVLFLPNNPINRAEAVKIITLGVLRSLGFLTDDDFDDEEQNIRNGFGSQRSISYEDITYDTNGEPPWFAVFVNLATQQRIVHGYREDDTYRPGNTINNAESYRVIVEAGRVASDAIRETLRQTTIETADSDWFRKYSRALQEYNVSFSRDFGEFTLRKDFLIIVMTLLDRVGL